MNVAYPKEIKKNENRVDLTSNVILGYVAAGLGVLANILDANLQRLEHLHEIISANIQPLYSELLNLENCLKLVDIVAGTMAFKFIKKNHLKRMKSRSLLVDTAIDPDDGKSSRATTHNDPVSLVGAIIHYYAANISGSHARTSAFAMNNTSINYGLMLANKGAKQACRENHGLKMDLNTCKGIITYEVVTEAFGMQSLHKPVDAVFN